MSITEGLLQAIESLQETGAAAEDTRKTIEAIQNVMESTGVAAEGMGNIFGRTFSKFSEEFSKSDYLIDLTTKSFSGRSE